MLFQKHGFPEENEILICSVTKVLPHSVFVRIEEYDKSGMIHISEISPGRIRNIRDYVKEGKVIICKVLRINREKGHIDLSLRRVSESQKRNKVNEIKQEQKAEKIIDFVAKKFKKDTKKMYEGIFSKVEEDYGTPYLFFESFIEEEASLDILGLDEDVKKELADTIAQRIKPIEVMIKGELLLITYDPNGVEIIKESIKKAEDTDPAIFVRYKGAGKYHIETKASDYKEAEATMKQAADNAIDFITKKGGDASFVRLEE